MPSSNPEKLLDHLGITAPDEISIEAIAAFCGATIIKKPLVGCEARLLGKEDKALIIVNSASSKERQRFSAAHEIGHWLADRGAVASCTNEMFINRWKQQDKETRANRFAADLLMPKKLFISEAKGKPITLNSTRELARVFQTSMTATAIRLVEHGSFPAMVICSDRKGRKWFISGPDVPVKLFPSDQPGPGSAAHNIIQGGKAVSEPIDVKADQWFDYDGSDRYWISEDSFRVTEELVVSLIWWEDEDQIVDIYETENW